MSKKFEDFIEYCQDNFYGFDGLHDSHVKVPPCPVYKLYKEDFYYDKENKSIYLNIGNYASKKLDYLLKTLFVQFDELSIDFLKQIKEQNITLILINRIVNQNPEFFETIDMFFKDKDIKIEKQGIWK